MNCIIKKLSDRGDRKYVLLDKPLIELAGITEKVKISFDGKRIIIEAYTEED